MNPGKLAAYRMRAVLHAILISTLCVFCGGDSDNKMFTYFPRREIENSGFLNVRAIGDSWWSGTRTSCVRECQHVHNENCHAVEFDEASGKCVPGTWLIRSATAHLRSSTSVLYSDSDACDETSGFFYNFIQHQHVCVFVSDSKATFRAAKYDCIGRGARLYTMKTVGKFTEFPKLMNSRTDMFWIGLKDYADDGIEDRFYWIDQEEFSSGTELWDLVWDTGKPDGIGEKHCVMYNGMSKKLRDDRYHYKHYYACERPK